MSNGTKFTTSQLEQLGIYQNAKGQWGKDGVHIDHPESQVALSKYDERSTKVAAKEDQGRGEKSIRFRVVVHSFRTHLIDPSNASMKQIEDCLTRPKGRKEYGLGIFPDDSPDFCDQPIFLQTKVKKGLERTEIEVLSYVND